jgi:predicted RNA-binding protein with RPS1 domain
MNLSVKFQLLQVERKRRKKYSLKKKERRKRKKRRKRSQRRMVKQLNLKTSQMMLK